ncbi:MAG: response regulator [Thiovulaceae bacterium]|nr:response regulator [Sulfurimonadaceae bacterium]
MKFDTSKYTILYAQEDGLTKTEYKKYLEEKFKILYIAKNGKEALKLYEKHNIDILVLDDNIPHLSGFEVAAKIREQDNNVKIIILLLTPFLDEKNIFEEIELCPIEYLHKPVEDIILTETLYKVVCELEKKFQTDNYFYMPHNYIWDKTKKILIHNSNSVFLTKSEVILMELLSSEKERIFSSQEIMEFFWENDGNKDLTFDALRGLIKRVRKKLPQNSIINIINRGYYLKYER